VQSLVYDAKITEWFSKNATTGFGEKGQVSDQSISYHLTLLFPILHKNASEDTKDKICTRATFNLETLFSTLAPISHDFRSLHHSILSRMNFLLYLI
jgi:hypothetical protein